ncbi:MAG: MFS transporter [Bacteroidota bacterium]
MSSIQKSKRFISSNWIILLFTLVQFLYVMDFMIIMPLGSFLMEQWELDADRFGYLISGFAISGGVFALAVSFFMHRFEVNKILCYAFLLFVAGIWATALAPSYWILLLARIFTGAFGGILGALILTGISQRYAYSGRSRAISFTTVGLALASVIGVPSGLFISSHLGWRAPFFLLAGIGVIISLLLYRALWTPKSQIPKSAKKPAGPSFLFFFKKRNPLLGLLFSVAVVFSQYTIFIYLAPYLIFNAEIPESELGMIYLVGGIATIISAPVVGYISDKWGKKKLFYLLSLLLIAPISIITLLAPPTLSIVLILAVFYFSLDAGRMIPLNTVLTDLVSDEMRASYLTLRSAVKKVATGLVGIIGGLIIYTQPDGKLEHFDLIGLIAIFSIFISLVLVFLTHQEKEVM